MKWARVARLLGAVFKVYSWFLWIPLLASLVYDADVPDSALSGVVHVHLKATTATYLVTFLFVFLLGYLLTALAPPFAEDLRDREAYFVVAFGWILCALLGALPFLVGGFTRDPGIAVFESMSGITTTGYSALAGRLESYPESVHVWRATLHLFGGMGIILVIYAIVGRLTEGGAKLIGGESGGDVTRLRPTLSQTAKALFGIYTGLNLVLFLALAAAFRWTTDVGSWRESAFQAYVHAVGSIATGGFGSTTDSLAAFHSTWVSSLVYVGMFLGATSFILYYQFFTGGGLRIFTQNPEFRFFALILAAATVVVSGSLFLAGHGLAFSLGHGAFMTMTSLATCGFTTMDPNLLPDAARLVLVLLMVTGGMVGSTAGAIKIARIQFLFQMTLRELERLLHPHAISVVKMGGRIVPESSTRRIVVFFFVYVTAFIAGTMGFVFLGYRIPDGLVASAASLGGVGFGWGLGAGFAPPVGELARVLGIVLMWLGRLEIFTALLLFVPATYRD